MKVLCACVSLLSLATGFVLDSGRNPDNLARRTSGIMTATTQPTTNIDRKDFVKTVAGTVGILGLQLGGLSEPAFATGRATLEQSYERYAPRIRAGGAFYQGDFKQMVAKADWAAIKTATGGVPARKKEDLSKADAGVAARARKAGEFSEDRVLVAADLYASAFSSQNAISTKTKKMKEAVEKVRVVVNEMQSVSKQGLGEETGGGGFFGFGAKKPSEAELRQKMKELYVAGGNAWNEYVYAANEDLALQFDRFEYVK